MKRDGTGPEGNGPMTGKGMGECVVPVKEGFFRKLGRGLGLGRGYGRGCGRGCGRNFADSADKKNPEIFTIKDLNR